MNNNDIEGAPGTAFSDNQLGENSPNSCGSVFCGIRQLPNNGGMTFSLCLCGGESSKGGYGLWCCPLGRFSKETVLNANQTSTQQYECCAVPCLSYARVRNNSVDQLFCFPALTCYSDHRDNMAGLSGLAFCGFCSGYWGGKGSSTRNRFQNLFCCSRMESENGAMCQAFCMLFSCSFEKWSGYYLPCLLSGCSEKDGRSLFCFACCGKQYCGQDPGTCLTPCGCIDENRHRICTLCGCKCGVSGCAPCFCAKTTTVQKDDKMVTTWDFLCGGSIETTRDLSPLGQKMV
jgi:hypothetical protein